MWITLDSARLTNTKIDAGEAKLDGKYVHVIAYQNNATTDGWYEPKAPGWLFAPGLDAHDGEPPDPDAKVLVDHHVAFGSTLDPFGVAHEGFLAGLVKRIRRACPATPRVQVPLDGWR